MRQGVQPWTWCGLVFLLTIALRTCSGLVCSKSGYCSIGKLKPWLGEISDGDSLRSALAARSYKKELIIMVTTSHRMVPTMQAIWNLRKLGLEHILMISTDAQECTEVAKLVPEIGCAWDNFKLPMKGEDIDVVVPVAPLWHTRWRTLARAIRLGYNVLCMDSDVIVFDDPYRYFKSPPLKDFVVLDQPEVLYHEDEYEGNTYTNGGIVYVQNARPDGPAAWLIAEVSDRLLRWVEDDFNTTRKKAMQTWCCYLDQDCFTDALSSVQTGRPFWHWAINVCTHEWYKKEQGKNHTDIIKAIDDMVASVWNVTEYPLPSWMAKVAGANTTKIKWFPMKMPNYEGVWPEEFGGRLYPAKRGNLSLGFLEQLKTDCSTCPMWPDPEDASTVNLARARTLPQEPFAYLPPFTVLGWFPRGRLGYWNTHMLGGGAPQQVVGHAHYIPDTDASVGKNVMKMLTDHYDWTLAHELTNGAVYFANQYSGSQRDVDAKQVKKPPKLIALHPRIRLEQTNGWQEFQQILVGLAQAASLSGRAMLWPDLPCNTSWVNEKGAKGRPDRVPLDIRQEWMPHGRQDDLQCIWLYACLEGCLYDHRGMLSVEFQHYYRRFHLQHTLEPARHNTAFIPGVLRGMSTKQGPAAQIVGLTVAEVEAHLQEYEQEQIVYIAHPIQVDFKGNSDAVYSIRERYSSCAPLKYASIADLAKNDPFKIKVTPRTMAWQGEMRDGRMFTTEPTSRAYPFLVLSPGGRDPGAGKEQEAEPAAEAANKGDEAADEKQRHRQLLGGPGERVAAWAGMGGLGGQLGRRASSVRERMRQRDL